MKKFLTLCEELDPAASNDPKWDLKDFLESKGIKCSIVNGTDMLYIDTGTGNVAVTVSAGEEDAESIEAGYGDFNVNDEVDQLASKAATGLKGMAGKVFGTAAQGAAGAIKQRQRVSQQAVGAYKKKTNQLQKDIASVQ